MLLVFKFGVCDVGKAPQFRILGSGGNSGQGLSSLDIDLVVFL